MMIIKEMQSTGTALVLLNRRSAKSKHPFHWCLPGGSLESHERIAIKHPNTSPVDRIRILRRVAIRETIEEAGGGSLSCGGTEIIPNWPYLTLPKVPEFGLHELRFEEICLPPNLIVALSQPQFVRNVTVPFCTTEIFIYLIDGQQELHYASSWKPRALLDYRKEIDEDYLPTAAHCDHGYQWVPLEDLIARPDDPIAGSETPLVIFLRQLFQVHGNEIREHIVSLKNAQLSARDSSVPPPDCNHNHAMAHLQEYLEKPTDHQKPAVGDQNWIINRKQLKRKREQEATAAIKTKSSSH